LRKRKGGYDDEELKENIIEIEREKKR